MLLHESRRETRATRRRRTDPARRAGPLALEPRAHRRRRRAGARGVRPRQRVGRVFAAGRHRRRARRGTDRRRHRLGRDRRPVRSAAAAHALAHRGAQSHGGRRHARWTRSRARASSTSCWPDGELDAYQLAHAARADFCRRLGRNAEARAAYRRAIELTAQGPARRFLEKTARGAARPETRLALSASFFAGAVENPAARSTNLSTCQGDRREIPLPGLSLARTLECRAR